MEHRRFELLSEKQKPYRLTTTIINISIFLIMKKFNRIIRNNFFIKKKKHKGYIKIIKNNKNFVILEKIKKIAFFPLEKKSKKSIINFILNILGENFFYTKKCGIISRLDLETKGVFIVSKSNLFSENYRNIKKRYITIVMSKKMKNKVFNINGFCTKVSGKIFINKKINNFYISTKFKILNKLKYKNSYFYILVCSFEKGKTHQIRASLKHKNIKILGDSKYGFKNSKFKESNLHSWNLSFFFKKKKYLFYSFFNKIFIKTYRLIKMKSKNK